jgi:hypothetical protein
MKWLSNLFSFPCSKQNASNTPQEVDDNMLDRLKEASRDVRTRSATLTSMTLDNIQASSRIITSSEKVNQKFELASIRAANMALEVANGSR